MKISSNSIIINIDSTVLSKEECKLLENEIIGGVILFDHNYERIEPVSYTHLRAHETR